jgi:hypothetical protein
MRMFTQNLEDAGFPDSLKGKSERKLISRGQETYIAHGADISHDITGSGSRSYLNFNIWVLEKVEDWQDHPIVNERGP